MDKHSNIVYINDVETRTPSMHITDQKVTYAYAISDEGVDYGTGYYLTQEYHNGRTEFYGPFNYEEDARNLVTRF